MKNYIFLFFLLLSCSAQERPRLPSLVNTKWEYKVEEGCTDYIHFKKDGIYEDYSCEIDYPFSGKYSVKKDTIYFTEIDLATNLPGEKRKEVKARYKAIVLNGKLTFVYAESMKDGELVKIETREVFFEKVE